MRIDTFSKQQKKERSPTDGDKVPHGKNSDKKNRTKRKLDRSPPRGAARPIPARNITNNNKKENSKTRQLGTPQFFFLLLFLICFVRSLGRCRPRARARASLLIV